MVFQSAISAISAAAVLPPPRLTSSPITCLRPPSHFCRSGRSASRDKPITRCRSPNRPERRRRAGRNRCSSSLRLSSGPDSRRVRWPDRLGSGLAALAEETREFPDSTGSLDSCTVWGADADRSKLRGATPSWWRWSGLQRLEPHPSAHQPELLAGPPSQKG